MMKKSIKTPKFWRKRGFWSKILSPFARIYASQTAKRLNNKGYKAKIPVICIGNLTAGGAGKTPTAIFLAGYLIGQGKKVHFLTRGYGGAENNPARVENNDTAEFGDEAVLLSTIAPTWVGADRGATAELAEKDGAEILIMDDGFQNPTLEKDFSLIVVDGEYGFGNGRVIPAGPLREPIANGLKRADAILIIGHESEELAAILKAYDLPKFHAELKISFEKYLHQENIIAFCALARPEKFYDSLERAGLMVAEKISYPDHYHYNENDLKKIFAIASERNGITVTTAKDFVKIPDNLKMLVQLVKANLECKEFKKLQELIDKFVKEKAPLI